MWFSYIIQLLIVRYLIEWIVLRVGFTKSNLGWCAKCPLFRPDANTLSILISTFGEKKALLHYISHNRVCWSWLKYELVVCLFVFWTKCHSIVKRCRRNTEHKKWYCSSRRSHLIIPKRKKVHQSTRVGGAVWRVCAFMTNSRRCPNFATVQLMISSLRRPLSTLSLVFLTLAHRLN